MRQCAKLTLCGNAQNSHCAARILCGNAQNSHNAAMHRTHTLRQCAELPLPQCAMHKHSHHTALLGTRTNCHPPHRAICALFHPSRLEMEAWLSEVSKECVPASCCRADASNSQSRSFRNKSRHFIYTFTHPAFTRTTNFAVNRR
jgi:hypothetical protein